MGHVAILVLRFFVLALLKVGGLRFCSAPHIMTYALEEMGGWKKRNGGG